MGALCRGDKPTFWEAVNRPYSHRWQRPQGTSQHTSPLPRPFVVVRLGMQMEGGRCGH